MPHAESAARPTALSHGTSGLSVSQSRAVKATLTIIWKLNNYCDVPSSKQQINFLVGVNPFQRITVGDCFTPKFGQKTHTASPPTTERVRITRR